MAMDHFREEVVVRHRRGIEDAAYYSAFAVMVLLGLGGLLLLSSLTASFNVFGLVFGVALTGMAAALLLCKDRIRTEYEYTFTNGELDFARVYNNQKRENLGTIRMKNVEAFGKVRSESFQKLINMPGMRRKNWFLNRGAELFYFYYQKENQKTMIVLEPSPEMAEMIRKYLPHGAWQA